MPTVTIGTMGYSLVFTARIPPQAQPHLQKRDEREVAAFGLTPAFGEVPNLRVGDLRKVGILLPEHWADTNVVFPIVHRVAFYIVPRIPRGMAVAFSMKGVNLRTGQEEREGLTDKPCQSYWIGDVPTPWIDGYRPSHAEAVRQFVPLRGETEMAADVSAHVGVAPEHPWKDGISAAFYLPTDLSRLPAEGYGWRGGITLESTLESAVAYGVKGVTRSGRGGEVEEVGIGAGALMRQKHPDIPGVAATDYLPTHLLRITSRIVWLEQYNAWAHEAGEEVVSASDLRRLEERQRAYEMNLWRQLGVTPVKTDVDQFPSVK